MNISFFSLRFDPFSIIAKEVNQVRNNVVCVVARLVFVFCCALTTDRCNAFQHIFVNQKKSEFYGPYFQTMLFLVTMVIHNDILKICRTITIKKYFQNILKLFLKYIRNKRF